MRRAKKDSTAEVRRCSIQSAIDPSAQSWNTWDGPVSDQDYNKQQTNQV